MPLVGVLAGAAVPGVWGAALGGVPSCVYRRGSGSVLRLGSGRLAGHVARTREGLLPGRLLAARTGALGLPTAGRGVPTESLAAAQVTPGGRRGLTLALASRSSGPSSSVTTACAYLCRRHIISTAQICAELSDIAMTAAASVSEASAPNVLAGRLRLLLVRLSRQLRRRDPSDLTMTQTSALATIVRGGPLSIGHLAEIEGLPSPAATRLADRLEEAGLVSRQANPADRRGVHLVATAKGSELLARRIEVGRAGLPSSSAPSARRTGKRSSTRSPCSNGSRPSTATTRSC